MHRGIIVVSLMLVGTVAIAAAQAKKLVLFIDGRLASSNLIVIKGRSYVPVVDVAEALNMKLAQSGGAISLESVDSVQQKGTIHGVVTYYFNRNYGDKPDVGASIWLVPHQQWPKGIYEGGIDFKGGGIEEIPPDVLVVGTGSSIFLDRKEAAGKKAIDIKIEAVKATSADGNGNFEFRDVLPGRYIVIMQSGHTKGGFDGSYNTRDFPGRIKTKDVTVNPGETVDCSQGFGMTAF